MTQLNRPLSPHLQVYRLPMLALISITHRATGIALSLAFLFMPYVLYAVAEGPQAYGVVQAILSTWYGKGFLFLCSLGLNFHLLNGVRHLFWDAGYNLDVKAAEKSAYLLFVGVILLTAGIWYLACFGGGL